MSQLGRPARRINRKTLNTTIQSGVLDSFKERCMTMGIPMNVVLEAFMQQFVDEEFTVKIGKSGVNIDLED